MTLKNAIVLSWSIMLLVVASISVVAVLLARSAGFGRDSLAIDAGTLSVYVDEVPGPKLGGTCDKMGSTALDVFGRPLTCQMGWLLGTIYVAKKGKPDVPCDAVHRGFIYPIRLTPLVGDWMCMKHADGTYELVRIEEDK